MPLTPELVARWKQALDYVQDLEHRLNTVNDDRVTSFLVTYAEEARAPLTLGWEIITSPEGKEFTA